MVQSIKMQSALLFRKKEFVFTFLLMLTLVLSNYFDNVFTYMGKDIVFEIMHPMTMTFFSGNSMLFYTFIGFYGLIVIMPACFSLFSDKTANQLIFIESRVGKKNYYFGKFVAVFLVTFVAFAVPAFIEIVLNSVAFSASSSYTITGSSVYDMLYIDFVNSIFWADLYVLNPYIYAVLSAVIFALASAVFACFTLMISTFSFVKFKIFLLLPSYVLLILISYIKSLIDLSFSSYYADYLAMFNGSVKNYFVFFIAILVIFVVSFAIYAFKAREDTL